MRSKHLRNFGYRHLEKKNRNKAGFQSSQLVVYRPESKLRHPIQFFREMRRDLLASRELAWQLMVRDISALYRQSFLGIFWAFIPPIMTALGFMFAKNANVVNIGETELPYPVYVMFSMTLWQTYVESLSGPLQAVTAAKKMLAKISFPQEAIILAKVGQVFFNFGIKLILIVTLFLWFRIPISWNILLAPIALVHLVVLGTAFGTFLAPIGALYNDISKGLIFITSFWMLLTPVVYPIPTEGMLATLVRLNPVTPLLVSTRELATVGFISEPQAFWFASLFALCALFLAWMVYRLAMPFLIERISA